MNQYRMKVMVIGSDFKEVKTLKGISSQSVQAEKIMKIMSIMNIIIDQNTRNMNHTQVLILQEER